MSAGRVSKLVPPSAGKRNASNNNYSNSGVARPSLKRPAAAAADGRNSPSTTSRSSSETPDSRLAPRSGAGDDYVSVQYMNGRCSSTTSRDGVTSSSCGHVTADSPARLQVNTLTSLEQQQQAVLAAHIQVRRS